MLTSPHAHRVLCIVAEKGALSHASRISYEEKTTPHPVRYGRFEFVKLNAKKLDLRDTYHLILTLSWPGFAGLVFGITSLSILDSEGAALGCGDGETDQRAPAP
jgi:hypothetical protein